MKGKAGWKALAMAVIKQAIKDEGIEWFEKEPFNAQFFFELSGTNEADYTQKKISKKHKKC